MGANGHNFAETRARAHAKINELRETVGLERFHTKKMDYLSTLWRRAMYLEQRTAAATREGKILRHDETELAALRWIIPQTIHQEAEIKRLRAELRESKKGEQR